MLQVKTYLFWHKNWFVSVQAQVSKDFEQKFLFFSWSRAYPAGAKLNMLGQSNWQRALCWVVCMSIIHFLEEYRQ